MALIYAMLLTNIKGQLQPLNTTHCFSSHKTSFNIPTIINIIKSPYLSWKNIPLFLLYLYKITVKH